jgi:hypothetical protein
MALCGFGVFTVPSVLVLMMELVRTWLILLIFIAVPYSFITYVSSQYQQVFAAVFQRGIF